ncbi:MAG: hypothetical protein GY700_06585 [Propionibacteriaceae bacterium]|nr:hypothetical protein [Propionibacteriaceae bacterium]
MTRDYSLVAAYLLGEPPFRTAFRLQETDPWLWVKVNTHYRGGMPDACDLVASAVFRPNLGSWRPVIVSTPPESDLIYRLWMFEEDDDG